MNANTVRKGNRLAKATAGKRKHIQSYQVLISKQSSESDLYGGIQGKQPLHIFDWINLNREAYILEQIKPPF